MIAVTRCAVLKAFCKAVLGAAGISIVAAVYYLPEASIPVVLWLLTVAIVWRPSPRSGG